MPRFVTYLRLGQFIHTYKILAMTAKHVYSRSREKDYVLSKYL